MNYTDWYYENDCAFYNENPDWGLTGYIQDNPTLYSDCITCSAATETITAYTLTDSGTYQVLIHYYDDFGVGPTTVTLHVFEGNIETFKGSNILNNTDAVWLPFKFVKNKVHGT